MPIACACSDRHTRPCSVLDEQASVSRRSVKLCWPGSGTGGAQTTLRTHPPRGARATLQVYKSRSFAVAIRSPPVGRPSFGAELVAPRARTNTCTRTHARTYARTHARTHERKHTRTQASKQARKQTSNNQKPHTYSIPPARSNRRIHARTHARTHAIDRTAQAAATNRPHINAYTAAAGLGCRRLAV